MRIGMDKPCVYGVLVAEPCATGLVRERSESGSPAESLRDTLSYLSQQWQGFVPLTFLTCLEIDKIICNVMLDDSRSDS